MAFRKEIIIYETEKVRVFINQCHNPGKKTWLYSVRKDVDRKCAGQFLGVIKWNGAWRQYCFYPDKETYWSSSCMQGITDFLMEITQIQRAKWRAR